MRQYVRLKRRAWSGDHEGVQESGGKVAEHALRVAQHLGKAAVTDLRAEIRDMPAELRRLEQLPKAQASDAVRVVIPRVIGALYTLRNKRSGGHTAAEVDPSQADASLTERMADWLMAETLRLVTNLPIDQAEAAVSSVVERRLPVVYQVGDYRRVLKLGLDPKAEILVLLYGQPGGATTAELVSWTDVPRSSMGRYLAVLASDRLVRSESEGRARRWFVLPTGERLVEDSGWLAPE